MPVWNASRSVKARIVRSLFNDIPPVSPDIRCLDLPKEDPRSQQAHRKSLGIPRNVRNVNGHIASVVAPCKRFFLPRWFPSHTCDLSCRLSAAHGSGQLTSEPQSFKHKHRIDEQWTTPFFPMRCPVFYEQKKMNPAWTKAVHSNFIHCTWTKQTLHPNSPTIELT